MKHTLLTVFIILFSLSKSKSQCETNYRVFNDGELAIYKAYYNWNFIWLEAADVQFKVKRNKDIRFFNLESIGNSLKIYDYFFMVRDTFRSCINSKTLQPSFYHRKTNEGNYKVDNKFHFNYKNNTVLTETYNSKKDSATNTFRLPSCTFDVLSAIYYTRCLDFKNLSTNDKIPIKVLVDNEFKNLYIRYLGKENVTTRTGETYKCIKFKALLVEGTIFKGGEDMYIWVTNDKKRVPVLVETKVKIGSVKAYLTHYKP